MKKVLFTMYSMNCGGVEKALLNIIKLLEPDKFDVTILFVKATGEYIKYIPSWIKIKEIEIPKDEEYTFFNGNKNSLINHLKKLNLRKSLDICKDIYNTNKFSNGHDKSKYYYEKIGKSMDIFDEEFDVALDFHGYSSFTTFYVSEKVNAKIKATWIHSQLNDSNLRPLLKYYEKFDYIYGVSLQCVNEFKNQFPELIDKVEVFYNIVDKDKILSMSKEEITEYSKENINILTVGRLSTQKGYDMLIKVAALLKDKGYKFKWYIIGEGEEKSNIQNIIYTNRLENIVHLLGYRENPYPYMKKCDLYIQTSRFEGFCITLAEAKLFNKPIVTTNFAGAREQIENNITGIITEFNEIEIFNAISKLLDDKNLMKYFSENLSIIENKSQNEIDKLYKLLERAR